MKHLVITGADGFVGRALGRRLLKHGLGSQAADRLTLIDLGFEEPHPDPRVEQITGSLEDRALLDRACAEPIDALFHLASVPGGAAEKNYGLGRSVNLDATVALLEEMRRQPAAPRFVFASTIAVYGDSLPPMIDETMLPAPALSYGAHKLACEVLVADATRLGWVQGCSLRLPGVVARPGEGAGLISGFMSQLFWKLAAGEPITLPVSAHGVAWWISARTCVENLVHAAIVDPAALNRRRSYQMPVLRLTMHDIVEALAARYGADRRKLVRYEPEPMVQRLFASYPLLNTPEAEALGFCNDGSVEQLVEHALAA